MTTKIFFLFQLGLKFERCFDQEPVAFKLLSEDYSKMIFLHCDRYVEVKVHLLDKEFYLVDRKVKSEVIDLNIKEMGKER